jgi:hypothetical protein
MRIVRRVTLIAIRPAVPTSLRNGIERIRSAFDVLIVEQQQRTIVKNGGIVLPREPVPRQSLRFRALGAGLEARGIILIARIVFASTELPDDVTIPIGPRVVQGDLDNPRLVAHRNDKVSVSIQG